LLLDLLRGRGIQAKVFDTFASFVAAGQKLGPSPCRPRLSGLRLESPPWRFLPSRSYSATVPGKSAGGGAPSADPAKILKELSDLRIGAPVVHESYGVGR